ncbi:epoxide hydrolase family protein [Rugosimonospora acidiphila]|uniref:epoxide hydrolase family protein n=1 Tax=Rugosimonospora acidiphila TaxID=556531 RepID=UPI0031EF6DC4
MEPFRIEIPQEDLDELNRRLAGIRWPDELPGSGWDYGVPLSRVRQLADYWRDGYDWRRQEAALNEIPQYTTDIDGQRVHFLHVRSADPHALPLILTHGWPGAFVELLDVIEPLSRDFHVVIPSIPGFTLSGPTGQRGWDVHRVARAWAELMSRLGYDRYGAQGGDWGSPISRSLGNLAPDRVVGVHLNYLPTPPPANEEGLSDDDRDRVAQLRAYQGAQPAFRVLQSTRPQTLAYALTDSPVAELAWLTEAFNEWAAPDAPITADRLLTTASLYWLTRTGGSAARLHRESAVGPLPCPVPVGVAVFPHDITLAVRSLAERAYSIVHWSEFDRGGHFAAMEAPDLLASDVRAFFEKLR